MRPAKAEQEVDGGAKEHLPLDSIGKENKRSAGTFMLTLDWSH